MKGRGMSGPGRLAAVLALASGEKVAVTTSLAKVTERTVYRWLNEEEFLKVVSDARAEMFVSALGRLAACSTEAVETLRALCKNASGQVPAGVQVNAARAILEFGVKLRDSLDLERRLAELERKLKLSEGVRKKPVLVKGVWPTSTSDRPRAARR